MHLHVKLDAAGRPRSPATLPGYHAGRPPEALALSEADLGDGRGSLLVRRGKGGRRREVGMDEWGWRSFGPGSRIG